MGRIRRIDWRTRAEAKTTVEQIKCSIWRSRDPKLIRILNVAAEYFDNDGDEHGLKIAIARQLHLPPTTAWRKWEKLRELIRTQGEELLPFVEGCFGAFDGWITRSDIR